MRWAWAAVIAAALAAASYFGLYYAMGQQENDGTVDKNTIYDAIKKGIVDPLGLPQRAADILVFQSARETAHWTAWYFQGPQRDDLPPTYNLFNRKVGSGKGEWTGKVKMIGSDPTRIFTDVYQSARDFRQRLTAYGDMVDAVAALRAGDGTAYFAALEQMGFSARRGDYAAYASQWAGGATA